MRFELRFALRGLIRSPGITLVSVATLALGLGAAIGLAAYASALIWPRLDAPEPERIVRLDGADGMERSLPFSYPDLVDYRQRSRTLEHLVAYSIFGAMIDGGAGVRHGWAQTVTGDYFELFEARPELGRLLTPDDERAGAPPVVVLSSFFWHERLGADPEIVGRQVKINGQPATVVGVVEASFQGLIPGAVYVPVSLRDAVTGRTGQLRDRDARWLAPVARLAPGVSLEVAREELAAIARSLDQSHPRPEAAIGERAGSESTRAGRRVSVIPVLAPDPFDNRMNSAARILMAGAGLLLLLACANVANLVLARATARRRQLGIQAALGAGRRRLAVRRLIEGGILVGAALPLALGLARGLALQLERYVSSTPVGWGDWAPGYRLIRFDAEIWGLAGLLAVLAMTLIAAAPTFQALRLELAGALRADGGGGSGTGRWGLQKLLVVLQVALAALLLVGAGLLGRSLWRASSVDPGFDPDGLLMATLFVPRAVGLERPPNAGGAPPALAFYRRLLERGAALPGVRAVALARHVPLGGLDRLRVARADKPEELLEVASLAVSPGYFETIGMPLVAGRGFDARDRSEAPGVAVVSRSFVTTHMEAVGEGSPIGRSLVLPGEVGAEGGGERRSLEVVGVVEDTRLGSLLEPPRPIVFLPFEQRLRPRMHLLLRLDGPQAPVAAGLRGWLRDHPLGVGLIGIASFQEQMGWALFYPRMNAWMALLCGLVGLVLAVTGVGSVLACSVARRRREMGIRQALGATPRAVRRLAHRESLGLVLLGLGLGVGGGLACAKLLESLLYGVDPWDPWTFVAVPVVLLVAAGLAADLPARRAARVDPREALAAE